MESEANLLKRQDEELLTMRAIAGDDWTDIAPYKGAWGKQEVGWWKLRLWSCDGMVGVTMRGKLPKKYPYVIPELLFEDPLRLSYEQVKDLERLAQRAAKDMIGREMIFELSETLTQWMEENHQPLPVKSEVPTLMEQKAHRDAQAREEIRKQEEKLLERDRQETQKKDEELNNQINSNRRKKEEELKRRVEDERERRRKEEAASKSFAVGDLEQREVFFDHPVVIPGWSNAWTKWRVYGSARKNGLWTAYDIEPVYLEEATGIASAGDVPSCCLEVIDFASPYYGTPPGRRKLDLLVEELGRLTKIKSNHVLQLYAVSREESPVGWPRLYLLTEKLQNGASLTSLLRTMHKFNQVTIKSLIAPVLLGLRDLHSSGVCHRYVRSGTIWVGSSTAGGDTVKLVAPLYAKAIIDMHKSNAFLRKSVEEVVPETWRCGEEIERPYQYTPARDVWDVALLCIQCLWGRDVLERFDSLRRILDEEDDAPSQDILDFLRSMLARQSSRRVDAGNAEILLSEASCDEARRSVPINFEPTMPAENSFFQRSPTTTKSLSSYYPGPARQAVQSRYREDFEEVEELGAGGFGQVVKVRHKLEQRFYAIKKIKLRPEDDEEKVYREVQSLSKVSNPHIVRYYQCWLEKGTIGEDDSGSENGLATPSVTAPLSQQTTEDDMFAAVNFDDLMSQTRSRSRGFTAVRFGDSSDDDEDEDEGANDSDESEDDYQKRGRAAPRTKPLPPSRQSSTKEVSKTLYIQMEYVEKQTLKEEIAKGIRNDECWRLFRQILEALAYLADSHIVHRDLKPSNILMDADGNVKIADFGLSTTDTQAGSLAIENLTVSAMLDEKTSGIGTSIYIAPEVAMSRDYGTSADLYSLGIIFFEMCFPMRTDMERMQNIKEIRSPSVKLPRTWPFALKDSQTQILHMLLRHDPAQRPSASDLLQSPLLPEGREEGYYAEAIRKVTDPSSVHYQALLAKLFVGPVAPAGKSAPVEDALDFTYDDRQDSLVADNEPWQRLVKERLVQLFRRHGAVDLHTPLLAPVTGLLTIDKSKAARLLDGSGHLVQLPSEGSMTFARYVSRKAIDRMKRYHFGSRYQQSAFGGQPRSAGEARYDIISPLRSMASEAEMLEVLDKIIAEFRGLATEGYQFYLNHDILLQVILQHVPERHKSTVASKMSEVDKTCTAREARQAISNLKLPKHVLDEIEGSMITDTIPGIRKRMLAIFPQSAGRIHAALDDLSRVIECAEALGVRRSMLIRPTLTRGREFYRGGFLFECTRPKKRREVIASGGRYDYLLEHFTPPRDKSLRTKTYGVGMSIDVDRLAFIIGKYESKISQKLITKEPESERSYGLWSPSRCDVYVASFGPDQLNLRLEVIGELWRAGIAADLQYDDDRTMDDIVADCISQNILFIVTPRSNRRPLKIRHVLRKTEEEVAQPDLVAWIQRGIADQRKIDLANAAIDPTIVAQVDRTTTYIPIPAEPTGQVEPDIQILLPADEEKKKTKTRHSTKSIFYDKVSDFVTSAKTPLPVLAVDLPAAILAHLSLANDWIKEDEAWKSLYPVFAGQERSYVESIRTAVREYVGRRGGKSSPWLWMFSLREAKAYLIHLP